MKKLSTLLVAVIALTACSHKPMQTFTEPIDPIPLTQEQQAAWQELSTGLNVAWGSPDYVYARSTVPQGVTEQYATGGWRGERVSAQLLLWSKKAVSGIECEISDFKSEEAKNLFLEWQEGTKQLKGVILLLEMRRDEYASADRTAKANMAEDILLLEKEIEEEEMRLDAMEYEIRRIEQEEIYK